MFSIFASLLELEFIELDSESDLVWHPDVRIFSVWDDEAEENKFLGYGHAANFNLQRGFTDTNGKQSYPATALVCNFTRPTPVKPSLLKHSELLMLFHELGHGIHDLVAKTIFAHFHGTMIVNDFCEPPSHEAIQDMNTSQVFNFIRKTEAFVEGPEVQHGRHLLGAYDVGYYEYLQAELYALDMFSTIFQSDPLNAKQGRRFGRMILEKGGGQDEIKSLLDYLGREPNLNALYERLGIK
ncbi:zincin [Aspergillus sclerotioniger CBS 115572]|uniref:Zincin n=1 Tax=Aspergillus sclerotioniger CBS 115572 TaxID=1450535 RepID=A0A317VSL9_9EURO|nr:zincin [Aspergillus sclerotioniger CBS 115572]PWY76027.1 zincin [Aspergillus sclerotioniger CBS 115572]